ncbi:MAG: exodeoxyribonuclease VII small subunit [Peptoclostridium sp.]|uniref:exodeoxyribonuclease VII small subunit n=1 Tax=Peptoclostridium sp. TaxID=1904860 RepID=UPI00139CDBD2|nr:exodeoxyribonuclease VII small subunit [Peptoclostridium sp.]MZQ75981.1 exodeoxyribonuclease VII small subunit [Peptoclostridium sp.]
MSKYNYETAYEKLEEIMKTLEAGSLPLDESLRLYEEGIKMYRICSGLLEKAQLKIAKLVDKDGEWIEENFNVQED